MSQNGNGNQRGRPVGGGQVGYKQVVSEAVVIESVCRMCGSHGRTDYANIRTHEHDGVRTQWKDCNCSVCGQRRTDIFKTTTENATSDVKPFAIIGNTV